MIKSVHLFSNGMVMVFDEHGQQMPDYQGPLDTVRKDILRSAPMDTDFYLGDMTKQTPIQWEVFADIHADVFNEG